MRLRNQVRWRLAYWRLASLCGRHGVGQPGLAAQMRHQFRRADGARAGPGRVPDAAVPPALRPTRLPPSSHRNARSMRAFSQSTSGRITNASASAVGSSGGPVSACHAAKPRPVARNTSQARCTRAGLARSIRAAVAASSPATMAAKSVMPQRIGLGPHRRRHRRHLGQPFGQRHEIQPRAAHDHHRPVQQAAPPRAANGPPNRPDRARHGRKAHGAGPPHPQPKAAPSAPASSHRPARHRHSRSPARRAPPAPSPAPTCRWPSAPRSGPALSREMPESLTALHLGQNTPQGVRGREAPRSAPQVTRLNLPPFSRILRAQSKSAPKYRGSHVQFRRSRRQIHAA